MRKLLILNVATFAMTALFAALIVRTTSSASVSLQAIAELTEEMTEAQLGHARDRVAQEIQSLDSVEAHRLLVRRRRSRALCHRGYLGLAHDGICHAADRSLSRSAHDRHETRRVRGSAGGRLGAVAVAGLDRAGGVARRDLGLDGGDGLDDAAQCGEQSARRRSSMARNRAAGR